jgi:hypothetical protein
MIINDLNLLLKKNKTVNPDEFINVVEYIAVVYSLFREQKELPEHVCKVFKDLMSEESLQ